MLRAGQKVVRIPVGDFLVSKHVPNGSAHQASTSVRTRSPTRGQSGRSVTLTTHLLFTTVSDWVDMDKTLYRNGYIFIIIRYVLNKFSVYIILRATTTHYTTHFKILHSPLVSQQIFSPGSCTQDRTPWRKAWESGASDVRRSHRFIEWNWGFLSWRPGSTLIVPNLFHAIVNIQPATNKQPLFICKSLLFTGFTETAGSLVCSPLTSTLNSLHAYAFIIQDYILIHSLKLSHKPDFLTFPKLEFLDATLFSQEILMFVGPYIIVITEE